MATSSLRAVLGKSVLKFLFSLVTRPSVWKEPEPPLPYKRPKAHEPKTLTRLSSSRLIGKALFSFFKSVRPSSSMVTTFFSACLAASLEASVSIIETWLPLRVNNKLAKAADGKNELPAAMIKAPTQTTGINHGIILFQVMTFFAGPVVSLATFFFSSRGALL